MAWFTASILSKYLLWLQLLPSFLQVPREARSEANILQPIRMCFVLSSSKLLRQVRCNAWNLNVDEARETLDASRRISMKRTIEVCPSIWGSFYTAMQSKTFRCRTAGEERVQPLKTFHRVLPYAALCSFHIICFKFKHRIPCLIPSIGTARCWILRFEALFCILSLLKDLICSKMKSMLGNKDKTVRTSSNACEK